MPRQRQKKTRIVNHRRVDDDVLSKPALVSLLLLNARRKDSSPVPVPVFVLPEMHVRMLCLQKAEQDPAVEQIAWIVSNRDGTRREEHGILVVANLNRVDGDAVEESTAHAAD